ncbi:entericidin A/B family lipoprotein [Alterisphingorhabdus coralli]|uniref:Entericidin A/B family lipoprotein n=1 Tax=Alterisphingorhabdus coralli TaxID=3071408 RepID=A0AA97I1C8_9SPHN|nr:entericidin A/B family lipoprotein [Parasphingorhabdus sp. SCSIO 66989]WOE74600.1 entericidin A/B family lipoprotein [Parasphingorhabdus sp. SCSIO 66989]
MRKPALIVIVSLTAMLVTACNTISGIGRDIESAGDAVADTAESAK